MPRLSRIRTGALEDLAEQLRFSPRAAVRRQVHRAVALAAEVRPGRIYAEDWVVRRLTGYRPETPEPAQFVGEALLGDLSAFVERVTDRVRFERADFDAPALTVEALCARWGVSRKTVERWRRLGLVGLRVWEGRGVARLLVPLSSVEAFESAHGERVAVAAGFTRLSDRERGMIVQRASRYRSALGWGLSRTAARLAARLGRAPETVRAALRAHDRGSASPLFDPARRSTGVVRRRVYRAWRRGERLAGVAARYGVSRATAVRLVNEQRAARLRGLHLPAPGEVAGEAALDEAVALHPGWQWGEARSREFVERARSAPPPNASDERALVLAYHAVRGRASALIAALPRTGPRGPVIDEAETLLRWATLLKAALVRAQRGVVLRALEERLGGPFSALPPGAAREVHRAAMRAVGQCIDRFDAERGGRLAAPVTLAIGRIAVSRGLVGMASSGRAESVGGGLEDWTQRISVWQAWLEPGPRVRRALGGMLPERAQVICARYGWSGERPLTMGEVASRFGVGARTLRRWERESSRAGAGGPPRSGR